MWVYDQATGQLRRNAVLIATGYAGHGEGLNNPAMEAVHNIGPIPRGRWIIGPAFTHPMAGPVTMRLAPEPGTDTFGRDGFLIHGDLPNDRREASDGCLIFPRPVRVVVAESEDRGLVVV